MNREGERHREFGMKGVCKKKKRSKVRVRVKILEIRTRRRQPAGGNTGRERTEGEL